MSLPLPLPLNRRMRPCWRVAMIVCVAALCAPPAHADYEAGFVARRDHLLGLIAAPPGTIPFPNFSNVHMHYWANGIATIESSVEGVNHPAVNNGTGSSTRPPIYWGILKYDGEGASGTVSDANRGAGSNTSFSWNANVFHFIFPGLAWLMGIYPDIPAWADPHHRTDALTYRENYLRYVLSRTDNYNAFTGEGTENHINMSRPSGWVLASEAVRLGYEAPGAPFTSAERAAQMREWILAWSKRAYEVGIGEWDSGTYHMVALQAWLTAFEYAQTAHGWDPEVAMASRAVIDLYAASLALKHVSYHIGGAESRSGRNFTRMDNGTSYLSYLWFDTTNNPPPGSYRVNQAGEAVYAAASRYRPPLRIVELARNKGTPTAETYHNLKPGYLMQQAGQSVEVVHHGGNYSMGSANMAIGSFHASTWQIFPWKLMVQGVSAQAFPSATISGNGGFYGAGILNTRDPWMQLVQHRNVLIQLHRVPANAATIVSEVQASYNAWKASWYTDFTARWSSPDWGGYNGDSYAGRTIPLSFQASGGNVTNARTGHIVFPSGASQLLRDNVRFIQVGTGAQAVYLAVRSVRGAAPGLTSNRVTDSAPVNQLFGLVMEVGTAAEHGSFVAFQDAILAATALDTSLRDAENSVSYTTLSGDVVKVRYETSGSWLEPDYDWNYGVTTSGGVALMHAAPWRQPDWPSGEGHGRQPTWWVNDALIDPTQWALIDGPKLSLDQGVLKVFGTDSQTLYEIDYSSMLPTFYLPVDPAQISSADGELTIMVPTVTGLRYQLQRSADMVTWETSGTIIEGSGSEHEFSANLTDSVGFFRVQVMP